MDVNARSVAIVAVNVVLLPVHFAFGALSVLAALLPIFPTRVGVANFKARLGVGRVKAHALMAGVYMHYALYLLEAAVFWPLGLDYIENRDALLEFIHALKRKYPEVAARGTVWLSGHYGNIESAGEALALVYKRAAGFDYHALAKPSRIGAITKFLDWYRTTRHIRLLWTDRKDLLRAMIDFLKRGDGLGLLCDQKPESGGIFIRFFGAMSAFPVAGLELGLRSGAPIAHLVSQRVVPGYFRLKFSEGHNGHLAGGAFDAAAALGNSPVALNEVHTAQMSAKERRVADIMATFAGWLEGVVAAHPTQWSWDYKKWSRTPPSAAAQDTHLAEGSDRT